MENFDRENNDELLKIRQYFLPLKFCAVWYSCTMATCYVHVDRHNQNRMCLHDHLNLNVATYMITLVYVHSCIVI